MGIFSLEEAKNKAKDLQLDLVEVVENENLPVCKMMDYGKYYYDQIKKKKQNRKTQKQHQTKIKEVKLRLAIGDNDYQRKLENARRFLQEQCKVKVTCVFHGRELARQEIGLELLRKFCRELEEIALIETPMKPTGRMFSLILAPVGKQKLLCTSQ